MTIIVYVYLEKNIKARDYPTTFEACHVKAKNDLNAIAENGGLTESDQVMLNDLNEVADSAAQILKSFQSCSKKLFISATTVFMASNAKALTQLYDKLESFDNDTWAPKVNSDNQAEAAKVYSEFIRDLRGVIRSKPEWLTGEKKDFIENKNVEKTLFAMADSASQSRSDYRNNGPQNEQPVKKK